MCVPGLTDAEVNQTIRACQRLLIHDGTELADLKAALLERLRRACPELARKLETLDEPRMSALRQAIVQQRMSYA